MKPIEQALVTLIGREPTTDEIAKFYKIKETCGFSDHDSVWSMLLAFGHYEILYGQIPGAITDQTAKLLAEHKIALDATALAAANHVKGNLVEHVTKAARDMAKEVIESSKQITIAESRNKFFIGLSLSMGIAALVVGLVSWGAYNAGLRSGAADVSWANSSNGKAAREFAELNDIAALMSCASGKRHTDNGKSFCMPYDERSKKISGWRVK